MNCPKNQTGKLLSNLILMIISICILSNNPASFIRGYKENKEKWKNNITNLSDSIKMNKEIIEHPESVHEIIDRHNPKNKIELRNKYKILSEYSNESKSLSMNKNKVELLGRIQQTLKESEAKYENEKNKTKFNFIPLFSTFLISIAMIVFGITITNVTNVILKCLESLLLYFMKILC